MKGSKKRIQCIILSVLFIGQTLFGYAASANAEGIEGDNLLQYEYADSEELVEIFEMGNLLLYTNGTVEEGDDGVIDDSVYLTEADDDGGTDEEITGDADDADYTGVGRMMGNNVSLRAQATIDSEIVAQLNEGANLTIVEKDGQWLHVTFGILEGWVHSDFVFEVTETGLNGTILRDGINFRSGNSLEAAPITQLNAGTGVQVTDYVDGWYEVTYSDNTGYVRNDCIAVTGTFTGETSTRMLQSGMSGDAVLKAQNELKRRGFFVGTTTGDYGPKTTQAVKDFQAAASLTADGIIGARTMELLYGKNDIVVSIASKSQVKGRVKMTAWSTVNGIIPRGKTFRVIDVRTGRTWKERRLGGYLHIDAEPVTASDTAELKRVYGGSWSWNRRAVWVVYGSYVFAASMNGMPHASQYIGSSNNFNGHHCYHFYKSRTHGTNSLDSRHQACVLYAYKAGK